MTGLTDAVANASRRGVAITVGKYAIAVAAFAWLLGQIDLQRAASQFLRIDGPTLAALAVVTVAGIVARFYTWQVVTVPIHPLSLREAGAVDLVVNFLNQLLPSRLSGRVAAPFVLRSRTGVAYADAAAISGVHTGMYALLYGITAIAGIAVSYPRLSVGLLVVLALSTAMYLVAGVFVLVAGMNLALLDPLVGVLVAMARRVPRVGAALAERVRKLPEFTASSTASFQGLATDWGVWLRYAVGWAGALVLAPGLRVWLLLGSFGVAFEPALLLPLYLVAAYSVTLLPITPGGIGVTEATATAVFVALGVPSEVVVPVILIDRILGVYLPALLGWYPSLGMDLASVSPE